LARTAVDSVARAAPGGQSVTSSAEQRREILSGFLSRRFITGIRKDDENPSENSYLSANDWLQKATIGNGIHTPTSAPELLALLEQAGERGVVATLPDDGRDASIVYRGDDRRNWHIVLGPEPRPVELEADSLGFPVQAIAIDKCNLPLRS
jgi:hypothetical protein